MILKLAKPIKKKSFCSITEDRGKNKNGNSQYYLVKNLKTILFTR